MNNLSLVGNLTRDPVLRYTPSGEAVCDLRIAVDALGDTPPLYLDLATFGPQAEACTRHLAKGRQIALTGRLVYHEWQAPDGTFRSRHSAVGRVEFLGAAAPPEAATITDPAGEGVA
jgi:single-strand DNA-binding protein